MSTTIIAAGGIVINPKREILWIYRRGNWDLPKGKLDADETIAQCAIREVEEETGMKNLILGEHIMITYHDYYDTYLKEQVTKETHWFQMEIQDLQFGIPQMEEDIEKMQWYAIKALEIPLENTYDNIKLVIAAFRSKL
jgi:8-oxo-dGTP pyrophosphatase MutT (NUDIX family)